MKYVLQETVGSQKGYYAHSTLYVILKLNHAKIFKTERMATKFKEDNFWCSNYAIVPVTDKELFQAKLANT